MRDFTSPPFHPHFYHSMWHFAFQFSSLWSHYLLVFIWPWSFVKFCPRMEIDYTSDWKCLEWKRRNGNLLQLLLSTHSDYSNHTSMKERKLLKLQGIINCLSEWSNFPSPTFASVCVYQRLKKQIGHMPFFCDSPLGYPRWGKVAIKREESGVIVDWDWKREGKRKVNEGMD